MNISKWLLNSFCFTLATNDTQSILKCYFSMCELSIVFTFYIFLSLTMVEEQCSCLYYYFINTMKKTAATTKLTTKKAIQWNFIWCEAFKMLLNRHRETSNTQKWNYIILWAANTLLNTILFNIFFFRKVMCVPTLCKYSIWNNRRDDSLNFEISFIINTYVKMYELKDIWTCCCEWILR